MFLISKSTYPAEQRVLRLGNLPPNCSTMEIKNYFAGLIFNWYSTKSLKIVGCYVFFLGRTILRVYFVLDESQRQTGEAFVMFANISEVELGLRQIDGKRIRNTLVKLYRSSEEQFRYYCDNASVTAAATNKSQTVPNSMPNRVNSVPDLCECQIFFKAGNSISSNLFELSQT